MIDYRLEHDFSPIVDDVARRIAHNVDQAALDKAAMTLERFGYVKVVRCGDCKFYDEDDGYGNHGCTLLDFGTKDMAEGFCSWAERREQ